MEQYIPKSALAAEIERRIKVNKQCMLGLRNLDYYQGKVDALKGIIPVINSLSIKEADFNDEEEHKKKGHIKDSSGSLIDSTNYID